MDDMSAELDRRAKADKHVAAVVEAIIAAEPSVIFGSREGPCIVEYRDWWQRGWPMRRAFSCNGCRYHEQTPEFESHLCNHPDFIAKYGGHQNVAHNHWWRSKLADVHAFSCPELRKLGVDAHCPLPDPEKIPGRAASKAYRRWFPNEEAEIFKIPQRVPYYVADAYERGERVDRQNPTY